MQSAERLRSQGKPPFKERLTKPSYIDQYRPTAVVSDFNEINFDIFKDKKGNRVNTLLLDFEGTCVPFNGWDVDPGIVDKIKSANFENIAIITNSKVKDDKSLIKLNWWAKQIGASIVFAPTEGDRKPSPVMLLKALQHFGVNPDQALMVGDKLSADVRAANFAGVKSVWRRERLGDEDLDGDKYLRRPAEKVGFKRIKHRMDNKPWESKVAEFVSSGEVVPIYDNQDNDNIPDWVTDEIKPIWEKSVVNGFGKKPKVVLSQEVKDKIPPGIAEVTAENIRQIIGEVDPKYKEKFDEFMWENGHIVSNVSTLARIPGMIIVAGLILTDHPAMARIAHAGFSLTDLVDGWAKRKSKNRDEFWGSIDRKLGEKMNKNASEFWGWVDQTTDKYFSGLIELVLMKKGELSVVHGARIARDIYMNRVVRPNLKKEEGIERTSSVSWGKAAFDMVVAADNMAIASLPHSNKNIGFQYATTSTKIASAPLSVREWRRRQRVLDNDRENAERVTPLLLAA